ncbi:hypothetical protein HMPREF1631_05035 [Arcanobacterium sp. S3PF19]|nr:hypothetical protein HMPREF1631_05035 [Arcanobacterium sp. S3PF19]
MTDCPFSPPCGGENGFVSISGNAAGRYPPMGEHLPAALPEMFPPGRVCARRRQFCRGDRGRPGGAVKLRVESGGNILFHNTGIKLDLLKLSIVDSRMIKWV